MGLSGHQNCVFKIFEGEELQDFMLSQYYSHHPKQLLTFYNPFKLLYVTSREILIPLELETKVIRGFKKIS